jgi:hypothetical protein
MTILERDLKLGDESYKFVRQGDKIAYDIMGISHAEIASSHGLVKNYQDGKPLVDDAGYLASGWHGALIFTGKSLKCNIAGNPQETRQETLRIAASITGLECLSE